MQAETMIFVQLEGIETKLYLPVVTIVTTCAATRTETLVRDLGSGMCSVECNGTTPLQTQNNFFENFRFF